MSGIVLVVDTNLCYKSVLQICGIMGNFFDLFTLLVARQ